jgi:hypothetical protein
MGTLRRFDPKFPDTAIDAGKAVSDDGGGDDLAGSTPAPAASHVYAFKLLAGTGRARDVVAGESFVLVWFKDKRTGGPAGHPYRYKFAGPDSARKAFGELVAMDHPGKYPMIVRPVAGVVPGFLSYTRS